MRSLLTLAVVIATVQVAYCAPEDAQKEIQSTYDRVEYLVTHKDFKNLVPYLQETRTSDYRLDAKSGKHKLNDVIQSMTRTLNAFDKVVRATVRIENMTVTATTATVTIKTELALATKPLEDRKIHVISETVNGVDTWAKVGGKWKLSLSKITSESFFRDGKKTQE